MTMKKHTLAGRVALVTGAGSGLGAATALALALEGVDVACVDVDAAGAERVSTHIRGQAATSLAIGCDVSDEAAVFAAVETTVGRLRRVDIVVNCAAIDYTLPVAQMSVEQWDRVVAVNLRAPFLFARAALPHMQAQKWGYFVNIASTAATRAWANAAAYHATKWGLVGFSRALGVEGRADGIRVTTVIPGGMQTHFFDRFVEQGIPMPDPANLQDPANVARVIVCALTMPPETALQEMIVTPVTETSWP